MFTLFIRRYPMLYRFFSRIREYIDNHSATKGRSRLFQLTVLLIVLIIISFIVFKIKYWHAFR